ncbi:S8 family serine peptidase [Pirellulales bacterium]|nr:S8 family serine peptidase [Pirellulales bacterium]
MDGNLGGLQANVGSPASGNLAAGAVDRYAFSVRRSELESVTGDFLLVGVEVRATGASTLEPAVPELSGLVPLATKVDAGSAYAMFAVETDGLKLLEIAGANAGVSGAYSLEISVLGDVNSDGVVDGVDAGLLDGALGATVGQPRYIVASDTNRDGVVDAADAQNLNSNFAFQVNRPPQLTSIAVTTHTDLEVTTPVDNLSHDFDGDEVFYRIVSATGGSARIGSDGSSILFTPAPGLSGTASFELQADDGFAASNVMEIEVNVSDAPLVSLDFVERNPRLTLGDRTQLAAIGDFADEQDVALPASYVTFTSTDATVAEITSSGMVTAARVGSGVLLVETQGLLAATAANVEPAFLPSNELVEFDSEPVDPENQLPLDPVDNTAQLLVDAGFDVSPLAVILLPTGDAKQLSVTLLGARDLTAASAGTRYFVMNPNVASVSDDGLITAVSNGQTFVTVINQAAEAVIPVQVMPAQLGPVTIGAGGGAVQGADGSLVKIAPGAMPGDATVEIAAVAEENLPIPAPLGFALAGAFRLELGDDRLNLPVELTVPVDSSIPVNSRVFIYRADALPDEFGGETPIWLQVDAGVVGADNMARTFSSVRVGALNSGVYAIGYHPDTGMASGNVQLMSGLGANGSAFAVTVDLSGNSGVPEGAAGGQIDGAIVGAMFVVDTGFLLDLPKGSHLARILEIPAAGAVQVSTLTLPVQTSGFNDVNVPLNLTSSVTPPRITSATVDLSSGSPVLKLQGNNLGTLADTFAVTFQVGPKDFGGPQGGQDLTVPGTLTFSGTEVTADIPADVVLGVSLISITRTLPPVNTGLSANQAVRVTSNVIQISPESVLAGVVQRSKDSVTFLDVREKIDSASSFIDNPNFLDPVGEVYLGAGAGPRRIAFTGDNTRAYVTGRILNEHGVYVIDTQTMRVTDSISVGFGKSPVDIAIDPKGHFAYVADQFHGSVYVIDVNPSSNTFHSLVETINIGTPANGIGLRDLAINADGTRLFFAVPNGISPGGAGASPSWISVVDISNPSSPRYRQLVDTPFTGQGARGVAATSRANTMIVTDFLSDDNKGFSVITGAVDQSRVVSSLALRLGSDNDQFDVNNASTVAITPDDKYAFVAGWSLPDPDDPSRNHFFPERNPAGSTIGIIKDPLTVNAQLVGATRAIPVGFIQDLAVTEDGKYLFATYPNIPVEGTDSSGAVLVYDIAAIDAAVNNPANATLLNRRGINDILNGEQFDDEQFVRNLDIDFRAAYGLDRDDNTFKVYDSDHAPIGLGGFVTGLAIQDHPFIVRDASGDDSPNTVFADGALRITYDLRHLGSGVTDVMLEAIQGNSTIIASMLGADHGDNFLVNLDRLGTLVGSPGDYLFRVSGMLNGQEVSTAGRGLTVLQPFVQPLLAGSQIASNNFAFGGAVGMGTIVRGFGGTDILTLGVARANVASINGLSLNHFVSLDKFDPQSGGTQSQAIYRGSAYDYLRLNNGREIYFQGIERLDFTDAGAQGQLLLVPTPNDRFFNNQWNLHVTDVPDAWRFTTGAGNILLVSLDSGLPNNPSLTGDLFPPRYITDQGVLTPSPVNQHGHNSISIMSSHVGVSGTAMRGVAGINWNSTVAVYDVISPNDADYYNALVHAKDLASANGQRIVFQASLQGEWTLTGSGSQAELEELLVSMEQFGLLVQSAGNGGQPMSVTANDFSAGAARLAPTHDNVISVGAVIANPITAPSSQQANFTRIPAPGGLQNAATLSLADYSNTGPQLTLVGPTDSPAAFSDGTVRGHHRTAVAPLPVGPFDAPHPDGGYAFDGTSAAAPNVAAIATLVWSVNPQLSANDLKKLLVETTTDVVDPANPGMTTGRDNNFGEGIVNAGVAVRRALALARAPDLAALYDNKGVRVPAGAAAAVSEFIATATLETSAPTEAPVGPTTTVDHNSNGAANEWVSQTPSLALQVEGPDVHLDAIFVPSAGMSLPVGISNGDFNIDDVTSQDFRWQTRGDIEVDNGQVVLSESSDLLTGLRQSFTLPEGAEALQFTIVTAELPASFNAPPDVFEVALLNADTMQSLAITPAALSNIDAFLNIQGSGEVYFGDGVVVPGATASGDVLSLDEPLTVSVDVSHIPAGTPLTLYFDLLGFGDIDAQIVIDDVRFTGLDEPGIIVSPTDGLATSEAGGTATFDVYLTAPPLEDVVVPLVSTNPAEATLSHEVLTFTPEDWNVPQTVTVTGISDGNVDGDQPYRIVTAWAVSLDARYHGINADDVRLVNIDVPNATQLPGDFDGDGDADGADFLVWQRNSAFASTAQAMIDWQGQYGQDVGQPVQTELGDFDFDGDTDGQDLLAWQRNPQAAPQDLADWQHQYGSADQQPVQTDLGDFDFDDDADGQDLLAWQRNPEATPQDLVDWQHQYGADDGQPVQTAPGDFDFDADADGQDLLAWQRNPEATPQDLVDWQDHYGSANQRQVQSEPEDFDFDGDADRRDLLAWQRSIGAHRVETTASIRSKAADLAAWAARYGFVSTETTFAAAATSFLAPNSTRHAATDLVLADPLFLAGKRLERDQLQAIAPRLDEPVHDWVDLALELAEQWTEAETDFRPLDDEAE